MLRADEHPEGMRADYTFDFDPAQYKPEEHAIWRELCQRQSKILPGRACREYLDALEKLKLATSDGIPDWRRVSDMLEKATGWSIVMVPGLIPGSTFLEHLANRKFAVTWWLRSREQMAYLKEPDIFHDLFGHVPMLVNPVFADYMHEWGKGALKARKIKGGIKFLTRLYWYTVEFGLINTKEGLRIYGSGIVSSGTESVYALESKVPHRIQLDVLRAMRTEYIYEDLQKLYFVIDSFEDLFDATRPDFTEYYAQANALPEIGVRDILPEDKVISRGE
jgi:phenylalanine-4-hydroxylase